MIYLVTSGEYSDFGVVAAYSNQEDAEQAVADGLGDSWEECPLDAPREKMPEGMKFYEVYIRVRDGHCRPYVHESYEGDGIDKPFTLKAARVYDSWAGRESERHPDNSLTVYCFAKDDEHACKIASEKRREHLAGLSPSALEKLANYKPPEPPEGMAVSVTKDMILNDGTQS